MQPAGFNPDMLQKPLQQGEFSSCVVITFQVMTVSGVSPGYPDAVRPVTEGGQYKLRAHTAGAGYADHPEIRGILKTAHTCQISGSIAAPVTEKGRNLRLPVVHIISPTPH